MGCFWGAERLFWQTDGVWVTAVGYAGGLTPNPTYQETCTGLTGHAEIVKVVYDPKIVSYADLLKIFWEEHDPTQGMRQGNDVGTTYRSAIYTTTDEQARMAAASRDAYDAELKKSRPRQDHHRDRAGAGVLLRRGGPPAVSGQEPLRLLRVEGHRRRLRDSRGGLIAKRSTGRRLPPRLFPKGQNSS